MKLLLVANRPMTYRTRRLRAGDTFWSPVTEADVWIKLKMARMVAKEEQAETAALLSPSLLSPPPPPAELVPQPFEPAHAWPQAQTGEAINGETADEPYVENDAPGDASPDLSLQTLREEYRLLTGKDADKRWGEGRLREKLNAKRG